MNREVAYSLLTGALILTAIPALAGQPSSAAEQAAAEAAYNLEMKSLSKALHPQFGDVPLNGAKVTLKLGDDYYFLPTEDAKRVLVDARGNPPSSTDGVLGLVFPAGKDFKDSSWGAVVSYEETGHVSDKDAADQDYESVLADMKQSAEERNEAVVKEGYAASHILGWAQSPTYDPTGKVLIWARNIHFDGASSNTLNYDVRTLGRTGVLSLNMVDTMSNLAAVRDMASDLGATVKFAPGARYADYDATTDLTADYGLAGLVAAGAGLGVAKKAGLLTLLALFLKKGAALLIAGVAGLGAWYRKKFGGGYRGGGDEDQG
jgi:uncharacterized membrane-anchored protein